MKIKNIFLNLISLSLISLFSQSVFATSVFVEKTSGAGIDGASLESTYELVKSALTQVNGYELSSTKTAAQLTLNSKLLKLGDAYILKVDKYQGPKLLYSVKMKASTLSDMDTVASRTVSAALAESSTHRNAQVGEVTAEEETQGTRRYQSTRQWMFSFGPTTSQGLNASKDSVQWNLGYVWGLDPDFDLKVNYAIYTPSGNASFYDFSLGLNYYLTREKNSFFVGGGFGRGSASVEKTTNASPDDSASSWTLNAGAGYKFFRTSDVNFAVIFNYAQMTSDTSNSHQTPRMSSLSLALFY